MNYSKKVIFFAAIAVSLLSACKKKEAEKLTSGHYFSAVTSTGADLTFVDNLRAAENKSHPYPYLDVRGYTSAGERIIFWIYTYTATTGVYPLDGVNAGASYVTTSGSTSDPASVSASGTLTLTGVSPDIVGTINFVTVGGVAVSGSFNVAQAE